MGLLSRLRGKGKDPSGSYVRAWAERQYGALGPETLFGINEVFAVMMYCVTRFGVLGREAESEDFLPLGDEFCAQYTGDPALFEVGCYFHFHTDLWLFSHYPDWREAVSLTLAEQYIALFRKALHMPSVGDLFDERLDMYGILTRRGEEEDRFRWYLLQLLNLTVPNGKPREYKLDNEPVVIGDALVDVALEIKLVSFLSGMVPWFREVLGKYIEMSSEESLEP